MHYVFQESSVQSVIDLADNYQLSVLFDFINIISEQNGFIYFSDQLLSIETLYTFAFSHNRVLQKSYSQAIQQLLIFSRRVLNFLEAFSAEFQTFLTTRLLTHCNDIQKQVRSIMDSRGSQVLVDELSFEMVVEIAETVARFASASHMYKDLTLDEDLLLTLLASEFPPIQSSTYLLLNHLY